MLWTVYCKNTPHPGDLRSRFFESHMTHLNACPLKILVGGPLTSDDGQSALGSFLIFEAESRKDVEEVVFQDPFFTSGLWESVEILGFRMVRSTLEKP